jgi:hypothetical protein
MVFKDYQAKSAYAQADLHQAFLKMRCAKGTDMREFLTILCYKHKELVAVGVQVSPAPGTRLAYMPRRLG